MKKDTINYFKDFLYNIELIELLGYDINLFRGQSDNNPLLPSICRENPSIDTTETEKKCYQILRGVLHY